MTPAQAPAAALPPVVVLISGRGSNLGALLAAGLPVRFAAVLSNRSEAAGLALAQAHGIPRVVLEHAGFASREAFDQALGDHIEAALAAAGAPAGGGLVILAGFMRIFTPAFTARFAGRLLNIHPSLLPAYAGLHTHRRALADGVRIHGCTVHYVTAQLDHGPIIAQAAVPVLPGDDEEALAARVLAQEHALYPQVVRAWAEGRLRLEADGRVALRAAFDPSLCLQVPA